MQTVVQSNKKKKLEFQDKDIECPCGLAKCVKGFAVMYMQHKKNF